MKSANELKQLLYEIDRKGYPAYKGTKGSYRFSNYVLCIEHVQGDPFASPSKLHVQVSGSVAGYDKELFDLPHKKLALEDYLIRRFGKWVEKYSFQAKGSGKSGMISVTRCGQEILKRSACEIDEKSGDVKVRFEVGFPANGRSIQSKELIKILFEFLPKCVEGALLFKNQDKNAVKKAVDLSEDQYAIRQHMKEQGLIAFVADGAILPRESGISSKPMKQAVAFRSPDSMRVSMKLPHKGEITGMGIRAGITLIVGGGYHGKSTLLKALEMGVYPHISGDGREYVVTEGEAVKIRAEDGRSIKCTDISMFINHLPNGKDTKQFSTEDASGSTSQAANVIEAMEAGAHTLLIDEDTSATNFMVRDELMQKVIHRDQEPITPFIERMRDLYELHGISTVLVAGSSGAYFETADTVIQMDRYEPKEITAEAKEAASAYPGLSLPEVKPVIPEDHRCPKRNQGLIHKGRIKIKTLGRDGVSLNREEIDFRYVEQLADAEQLTCLGYILRDMETRRMDGRRNVTELVEHVYRELMRDGFAAICEEGTVPGNLSLPRKQEIYAAFHRYRGLKV